MILTKEIETSINHLNIKYYKSLGYNALCNHKIVVSIDHLPSESNKKILVKCDICGFEKILSHQKYNKNILKYGIYSCSTNCSQFKIKSTNLEKYGNENYVNTIELKRVVKIKYDKITKEIEDRGHITCISCLTENTLSEYLIKSGRYKHICRKCRNYKSYARRNGSPHTKAWRNILRGYLLRTGLKKNDKSLILLGYTPEDLRLHISNLFYDNLSWDNYGSEWHIDHIIHISLFKYDTPTHIVNGLENIRPLKAHSNISRHNNLDGDCCELINKYKTYIKEEYIKI